MTPVSASMATSNTGSDNVDYYNASKKPKYMLLCLKDSKQESILLLLAPVWGLTVPSGGELNPIRIRFDKDSIQSLMLTVLLSSLLSSSYSPRKGKAGGVFSNLLSLGGQLISAVNASAVEAEAPSSSPWLWVERESNQMEAKLKQSMELLERTKAALYDAGERGIRDLSVKLWLKELRALAYDADDVL